MIVAMDPRIRITKSLLVGKEGNQEIYYIEGFFPLDENDPVELPTTGIATGSLLEEVESGMILQYSEASEDWIEQFSIQGEEDSSGGEDDGPVM